MNMKKLIESMDRIEECGMAEGPMGMNPPMAPEMDKGNPVTVNVSMNASGKEHVADLLDMMKNAGLGDAAPAADAMMSPRMDMERLSGIMGKPEHDHDDDKMNLPAIADLDGGEDESYANEMDDEADLDEGAMSNIHAEIEAAGDRAQAVMDMIDKDGPEGKYLYGELEKLAAKEGTTLSVDDEGSMPEDFLGDLLDDMGISAYKDEAATEDMSGEGSYTVKVKGKDMAAQEELARLASLSGVAAPQEIETEAAGDYANEPDEQYSDLSAVIPDGDDLHKKKKSHPATAGGDNPMAIENIKAALYAALTEKKMSEGEVPAGLKAYQAKKGKGKAPAKGKSKSGKMPMDAGKDGKKGTKDDKPAFLKKEEMTAEGRGKKTKVMAGRGRGK
jgi:hypothetical protein